MMVPRILRAAALTAVSLVVALPAVGQTSVTVTFQNADPGAPTLSYPGFGGVYGGFYDETWNGGPWHNANVKVVTDDFYSSVNSGNTWTANVFNATALATNPGIGEFNIGVQGYAQVADLVMAMFNMPGNSGTVFGQAGITQADISAAIWFITGSPITNVGDLSSGAQFLVEYVQTHLNTDAVAQAYLLGLKNLYLSVPAVHAGGTQGPFNGAEEDWLYMVPEGGTALLYLLLAAGFCFGAMRSSCRGRMTASTGC